MERGPSTGAWTASGFAKDSQAHLGEGGVSMHEPSFPTYPTKFQVNSNYAAERILSPTPLWAGNRWQIKFAGYCRSYRHFQIRKKSQKSLSVFGRQTHCGPASL